MTDEVEKYITEGEVLGSAFRVRTLTGFQGEAILYRLEPVWDVTNDFGEELHLEYVVVSAVVAYSGPETYIFPSNAEGEVTSWGELPGSFQGDLDHNEALLEAGYSEVLG